MALYSRLFKYAPRPGRTQLENFLTESFCDCLERMTVLDRKGVEAFILDSLGGSRFPLDFRDRLASAKDLRWTTQHPIYLADNRGYLDLCLLADKRIVLAVENKIGSGFTSHLISEGTEDAGETTEELSQLDCYDRWLATNSQGSVLVLLTHLTDAPPDFLAFDRADGDVHEQPVFHSICRWAAVYDWIAKWREVCGDSLRGKPGGAFLDGLAGELLLFLEQKNMSIATIKDSDLELIDAYFSQDIWKKLHDLMASIRLRVVPSLTTPRGSPRNVPQTDAWEETQILWDWAYCHERELGWYVGWGLSGEHGLRHLDVELDTTLQAFVVVTNDDGGTRIPFIAEDVQLSEKAGWSVCESKTRDQLSLVKSMPTRLLAGEPEGFSRAFEVWTAETVKEGASVLDRIHTRSR
jgi:hypothetical protein